MIHDMKESLSFSEYFRILGIFKTQNLLQNVTSFLKPC